MAVIGSSNLPLVSLNQPPPARSMTVTAEQLIEGQLKLPTLPVIIAKINALVDDPEVGTREIGQAVNEDAPIAAQVLRIANSAFYGLRAKVLSTEHATAILGVRQLRNIAMQASVIKDFKHLEKSSALDLETHWRSSILTSQLCAEMSRRCRARVGLAPEEFHVVGLLLNIGKIVLLEGFGQRYADLLEEGMQKGLEQHEAERASLGFDHAKVGALVATKWGLFASVSDAIERHHLPSAELTGAPVANLVAHVSRIANAICSNDLTRAREVFSPETLKDLGLRETDVEHIIELGCENLTSILV